MGEFFAELFGELLFKPIIYGLCFATGKPIVYVLSAGTLHAKSDAAPRNQGNRGNRNKRDKARFLDVSVTYVQNKKRYLQTDFVALVGLLFWALAIAVIVLAVRGGYGT